MVGYKNHALNHINILRSYPGMVKLDVYHPSKTSDAIHNDWTKLLDSDCLILACPPEFNTPYLAKLSAAHYSGYIYIEKPPFVKLADKEHFEELAGHFEGRIVLGFNLRRSVPLLTLRKLFNSQLYGELVHMDVMSSHGLAYKQEFKGSWRSMDPFSIAYTVSIHFIDAIQFILGSEPQIDCSQFILNKETGCYDTHSLHLSTPSASFGVVCSWGLPKESKIRVMFRDAVFTTDVASYYTINYPRDSFDAKGFFTAPERTIHKQCRRSTLKASVTAFLGSVRKGIRFEKDEFRTGIASTVTTLQAIERFAASRC